MRILKSNEIAVMDLENVTQLFEDFLRLQKAYALLSAQCNIEPASQTQKQAEEEKKIKSDYAQCCQSVSALASRKYELDTGPVREKLKERKLAHPDYKYLSFEKYEEVAKKTLTEDLEITRLSNDQQVEKRVIEIEKLILIHDTQLRKAAEIDQLNKKLSLLDRQSLFASACHIIAEHQSIHENSFNAVPLVLCSVMGIHISARLSTETLMQFTVFDFSKNLRSSAAAAANSSAMEDHQHIWQPQQIAFALEVIHDAYFLISREKDNAPTKLDKLRELIMLIYGIISTQNQRYYSQYDVMIAKPIDTDVLLYDSTMKEILDALESCSKFPRGRIKDYVEKLLDKIKHKKKWDFELLQKETGSSAAAAHTNFSSSCSLEVKTNICDDDARPVLPLRENKKIAPVPTEYSFPNEDEMLQPPPPPPSPPPAWLMPVSFVGNLGEADYYQQQTNESEKLRFI